MANITTDVGKSFLPTVWSKEIIRARERNLVLAAHVKRFDQDVASYGDTIKVPYRALRTASTKAPGGVVTYTANSEGLMTIAITTQAYDAFILEDIQKVQSKYELMREYTEGSAYAISKKVDDDIFTLAFASIPAANTTGTASTTVRMATTFITTANQVLDLADAPMDNRYMTVDGYGYKQLLDLDSFVRYDAVAEKTIRNGKIGEAYGIGILRTNNQPNATNISKSLVFHQDALALAMQKDVSVKDEYSVDYIGTKVVSWNLYGMNTARSNHLASIAYGIG